MNNNYPFWGAMVTGTSYALLITLTLAPLAIIPYLLGSGISAYGLAKKKNQDIIVVYVAVLIGTFFVIPILPVFGLGSSLQSVLFYIYMVPAFSMVTAGIFGLIGKPIQEIMEKRAHHSNFFSSVMIKNNKNISNVDHTNK